MVGDALNIIERDRAINIESRRPNNIVRCRAINIEWDRRNNMQRDRAINVEWDRPNIEPLMYSEMDW